MSQIVPWNILCVSGVGLGSGQRGIEKYKSLRSVPASSEKVESELIKCTIYDVRNVMGGSRASTW